MTDTEIYLGSDVVAAAEALEQASVVERLWHFQSQCDMFAQEHSWVEAEPYLTDPRLRLRVAHARVLRGEDLSGVDLSSEEPSDHPLAGNNQPIDESGHWAVPLRLAPWESAYWEQHHLTTYYPRGSSGSNAMMGFPPEHPELPLVILAQPFDGPVDVLDKPGYLGDWIDQVTVFTGTAEQAIAHHAAYAPCGHPKASVHAAVVDLAAAYPAMLNTFGGAAAFGYVSESLGRLEVWRLLGLLAGSTAPTDITNFVNRIRCMTWQDPCDEIWYLHLAIEDPTKHTVWVLDGQDFD